MCLLIRLHPVSPTAAYRTVLLHHCGLREILGLVFFHPLYDAAHAAGPDGNLLPPQELLARSLVKTTMCHSPAIIEHATNYECRAPMPVVHLYRTAYLHELSVVKAALFVRNSARYADIDIDKLYVRLKRCVYYSDSVSFSHFYDRELLR